MKNNKYFKAKLMMDTEDECFYNTFTIYISMILELLLIALLQRKLNITSLVCLSSAGVALCRCSYKIGKNSRGSRRKEAEK